MPRLAARTLLTMGLVMAVMAGLIRLAKLPPADVIVDDLAIITSLAGALLGAAYLRFVRS